MCAELCFPFHPSIITNAITVTNRKNMISCIDVEERRELYLTVLCIDMRSGSDKGRMIGC